MYSSLNILKAAHSLASHAYQRQSVIATNIANADTPDYKARDLAPRKVQNDVHFSLKSTRPEHDLTPGTSSQPRTVISSIAGAESPNGNTVSLEDQMVRSAEIQQQHELALGVYSKSMAILKLSLGRRS